MYSNDDLTGLQNYLKQTPEGGLRKMLVAGKLTETHFRLLMKIAKGCSEADFISAFNDESLPKMKFSPAENQIRDSFWPPCKAAFVSMGLLQAEPKAA